MSLGSYETKNIPKELAFTAAEYEHRLTRVRAVMAQEGSTYCWSINFPTSVTSPAIRHRFAIGKSAW